MWVKINVCGDRLPCRLSGQFRTCEFPFLERAPCCCFGAKSTHQGLLPILFSYQNLHPRDGSLASQIPPRSSGWRVSAEELAARSDLVSNASKVQQPSPSHHGAYGRRQDRASPTACSRAGGHPWLRLQRAPPRLRDCAYLFVDLQFSDRVPWNLMIYFRKPLSASLRGPQRERILQTVCKRAADADRRVTIPV